MSKDRRMFSNAIVESDVFLDMPLSTQALYFHLVMNADDEGFVGNPKRVQRLIGASDDDMKILLAKRYALTFDSGIIVIKHWYVHNYIPKDRYHNTTYIEEKNTLMLDSKKAYTERQKNILDTTCIQNDIQPVYNLDTEIKLNEIKRNEIKEENMKEEKSHTHNDFLSSSIPTLQEVKDFFILKSIKINPERFYNYYSSLGWKKGNTPIENWQLLALEWNRKDLTETRLKNGLRQRDYSREDVKGMFGNQNISDDEL